MILSKLTSCLNDKNFPSRARPHMSAAIYLGSRLTHNLPLLINCSNGLRLSVGRLYILFIYIDLPLLLMH